MMNKETRATIYFMKKQHKQKKLTQMKIKIQFKFVSVRRPVGGAAPRQHSDEIILLVNKISKKECVLSSCLVKRFLNSSLAILALPLL